MPKNRNRNIQGNERPKSSDVQFSSVKDLGVGKKRSRTDLGESDTSMANSTVHSTLADNDYDHDLNKLDTLLQSLSKNENATKKAVSIILNHDSFKSQISELLIEKVSCLQQQVDTLECHIDDLEQYSRRNCIKITGVSENKDENSDDVALNVINKLILGPEKISISIDKIERSHRVGKPRGNRPRDIIVKFTSYRDRALVYAKKSNLKKYNKNDMNEHKIFINESLTKKRMDLLIKTKNLLKNKYIDSVWTYDGRIVAKTLTGKKWTITRVTDFEKLSQIVTRGPLTSTPAAK